MWHLVGKWLIKTRYLSLVNILAEKELVPEFMPYFNSIEPIIKTIEQLLADKNTLSQISDELIDLTRPLTRKKAGEQVAEIVIKMLD